MGAFSGSNIQYESGIFGAHCAVLGIRVYGEGGHCFGWGQEFSFVLDLIVSRKQDQPGALDLVKLMASPLGGKRVGPWLAALKSGQTVDGVTREEVRTTRILPVFLIFSCYKVCGPALVGRKVVVLGDTCDPSGEDMKLSLRNIF